MATRAVLQHINAGVNRRRSSRNNELRRVDYARMLRREPRSLREILNSEIPFHAAELPYQFQMELQSSRYAKYVCDECNRSVGVYLGFFVAGRFLCAEHVKGVRTCIRCHNVRSDHLEYKQFDGKVIDICRTCRAETSCNQCHGKLQDTHLSHFTCANCIETPPVNPDTHRPFSYTLSYVDQKKGAYVSSKRIWSTEIECILPRSNYTRLASFLPPYVGMGHDGSIRVPDGSDHVGVELQTPRLAGQKGEALLSHIASSLSLVKAAVNKSCGMHIHIDATGLIPRDRTKYPKELVNLWKGYLVFEDVFHTFVPFERRMSRYCAPLRDGFTLAELENVNTVVDAEKLWYRMNTIDEINSSKSHHYHTSRYFGVNFHCLFSEEHLEIRTHSGTMQADKILKWADLHTAFVDAAVTGALNEEMLLEAQALSLPEKTNMLFSLLNLQPESVEYFLERQKKFSNKYTNE